MNPSPVGTLNKTDWKKIAVGAGIAVAGAALTYLTEVIPTVDLGEVWTPIVMAGWSVLANIVRKWLTSTQG